MQNVREEITNRIIEALEAGTPPWRQGWAAMAAHFNASTNKPYQGINQILLGMSGFSEDPRWLTIRQANAMKSEAHPDGLRIRKGEKSSMIVRLVEVEKSHASKEAGEGEVVAEDARRRLVMKTFRVFNGSQIEGMEPFPKPVRTLEPNAAVEHIIDGLKADGLVLLHGGDTACYMPKLDTIRMPDSGAFVSSDDFHSTLLHEAAHATGAKKRLDRFGLFNRLSSAEARAREELSAEIASMLLGSSLGVAQSQYHEANHHAYIGSWIQALKSDKNEIFKAAGAAQHIADWLTSHAISPAINQTVSVIPEIPAVEIENVEPVAPRRKMRM
ncbi:MAG: zincin-like metallopeptidase domain-containing protein [Betaproteobacteria bacterium]